MNICLFSPYVPDHFGGGEKYFFDVARILAKKHQVKVAIAADDFERVKTSHDDIKVKYRKFLNFSLKNIEFISSPLMTNQAFIKKLLWTRQFDLFYYLTDGSLFFSLASRNILHIQFPLKLDKSSFVDRAKLRNWQVKNTNSEFTKGVVEKSWPVSIDLVHQPLINLNQLKSKKLRSKDKEKIILNVGRFFRHLHSKRQDVLVKMFRELKENYPQETGGWQLVLIGGVDDQEYFNEVKKNAQGLSVKFLHDLSKEELIEWYARSSIYWHATGFGVDEDQHPERVEHFGISTAEAMAVGCVPLVCGKGGQLEVLGQELRELSWQTQTECLDKTVKVIKDSKFRGQMSKIASKRVEVFSEAVFEKKLWQMVGGET